MTESPAVTSPVILRWTQRVGGTRDPVSRALVGGTETAMTETVQALVHTSPPSSAERMRVEVAAGDVMLDLPGSVDWTDREGLSAEIGGLRYVPKTRAQVVAQAYESRVGGQVLFTTTVWQRAQ